MSQRHDADRARIAAGSEPRRDCPTRSAGAASWCSPPSASSWSP